MAKPKFAPAIVNAWKGDIWDNARVPKAIDKMSLAVGFALGKGATFDEAFAFARSLQGQR